jgi:hypothetical protein
MLFALALMSVLTACGGSGSPLAVISSFSTSASSVAYGGSATLSWAITDATSVSIDNGVGAQSGSSGSVTVQNLTATTTYTLTATNKDGKTTTSSVKVGVGPKITSFSTTTPSITLGSSATFSWVVASGATVTVDNGCTASGNQCTFTPTAAGSYTVKMTAADSDGNKTTATIALTVYDSPQIVAFSGASSLVAKGSATTLTWSVNSAATSISIVDQNNQSVGSISGATGSISVAPSADTTYTLNASNSAGTTATAQYVVDVLDFTSFKSALATINAKGAGTTLSWGTTHSPASLTLEITDTVTNTVTTQDVTGSTSLAINPTEATSYKLIATDGDKNAIVKGPVSISVAKKLGAIYSFLGTPASSAAPNSTITLTAVFNATDVNSVASSSYMATVTNDQDSSLQTGTVDTTTQTATFTPTVGTNTTTYTLTVDDGQGGTEVQKLRVIVGSFLAYSGAVQPYISYSGCSSSRTGWTGGTLATATTASTALYCLPYGMDSDADGNIYFADYSQQVFVKAPSDSAASSYLIAGTKGIQGKITNTAATSARYYYPKLVAVDRTTGSTAGTVYTMSKDCTVRKLYTDSSSGTLMDTVLAGKITTNCGTSYEMDGTGTSALLSYLSKGITVDSVGDVIVASGYSLRVINPTTGAVVTIGGKCTSGSTGTCSTVAAGTGDGVYTPGSGTTIGFKGINLMGVAIDANDVIYVADDYMLRKITPTKCSGCTNASQWTWTASTLISGLDSTGTYLSGTGHLDGPVSSALLGEVKAMTIDSDGTLYISEGSTDVTISYIRRVTQEGVVDTIAGDGTSTGSTVVSLGTVYTPITSTLPGQLRYGASILADPKSKRLFFVPNDTSTIYVMPR